MTRSRSGLGKRKAAGRVSRASPELRRCARPPARKISRYGKREIARLLNNEGIVRNRLKIDSSIANAKAFLAVQEEFGSFDAYVWQFVGGKPKRNALRQRSDLPASTAESDALSKDLRKRGFSFVGTTICYAFMQAVGMVNDHMTDCFRYKQV